MRLCSRLAFESHRRSVIISPCRRSSVPRATPDLRIRGRKIPARARHRRRLLSTKSGNYSNRMAERRLYFQLDLFATNLLVRAFLSLHDCNGSGSSAPEPEKEPGPRAATCTFKAGAAPSSTRQPQMGGSVRKWAKLNLSGQSIGLRQYIYPHPQPPRGRVSAVCSFDDHVLRLLIAALLVPRVGGGGFEGFAFLRREEWCFSL